MNLIKPKKLQSGDTISIVATSGNVDNEKLSKAVEYFNNMGYKVKLGSHINCSDKYLAGNDSQRVEDLHNAFLDKEVKAIICARGGYGALRLVDKIDYEIIRNNPKIFCGYSDVTILNAMFLKNAGLLTFSGAMAISDFSGSNNEFTENWFYKALRGDELEITPINQTHTTDIATEGILFGGNLATLTSLCGLNFIPDEKFILFVEDINEPAYKIDRYFTQLLNIKEFKQNLKAIVCGDFIGIDNQSWLEQILTELHKELNIPVINGFQISHCNKKVTIPYGANAKIMDNKLYIKDYLLDN